MSERCPECGGEGERWYDRDGWDWCKYCGGEGRIDPYQEDEWYEDEYVYDAHEEYLDQHNILESTAPGQPLPSHSPAEDSP